MDIPPVFESAPYEPLAKLTYPLWVRLLAIVTAVAFVFALSRVPQAIGSGIDAERGKRNLAAGRFQEAALALHRVFRHYPDAKGVRLDYAEACLRGDRLSEVAETLEWFEGKSVSKDENERLTTLEEGLAAQAKALETSGDAGE